MDFIRKNLNVEALKVSRLLLLIVSAGIGYKYGYLEGNDAVTYATLLFAVADYTAISFVIAKLEKDSSHRKETENDE